MQPKNQEGDMCFEVLGYDIFIDERGKPNLLEINHLPSLNSDTEIDRDIKDALLYDSLKLLNCTKLTKA
jgi:tubulin polyglutamylase TTLL6/13